MTVAPPLFAIIGPTASGKSALALELARKLGGHILSVDSMQVYRGMDVGTAKPSLEERQSIVHHAIDVVDPHESFAVSAFVELADRVIDRSKQDGVPLIAAGGTPMYFKSLFEGLFEGPGADAELRSKLNDQPLEALHARLREVDPEAAARIHLNDRKRIVRALEVFELAGKPITSLQREWGAGPRHAARWIGMAWERDALNRRINARVRSMIAQGWLDEVRTLLTGDRPLSRTASEATGYAELIAHLQGQLSLDDAIEQIKIATRQLARRQMKWFRRFENVRWIAGDRPLSEQLDAALSA